MEQEGTDDDTTGDDTSAGEVLGDVFDDATSSDIAASRSYLKLAAIPLVALVIGLIVVSRGGGVPGLGEARDRWEDNGPASYSMTYETGGMAGSLSGTVVVIDGSVDTFVPSGDDGLIPFVLTVEDLFQAIDEADEVDDLEFDGDLGHPVRFDLDPETNAIDDEWSFRLVSLDVID